VWAGLPQLTGPASAQKGWADLGPTILSASLGSGRTRPRHKGWVRKKKRGGGIIFPSPPPECRTIYLCLK